jgi:hypothetical protein
MQKLEASMDQHDKAVRSIFAKLHEVIDLANDLERKVNGLFRPNALVGPPRLAVDNDSDPGEVAR